MHIDQITQLIHAHYPKTDITELIIDISPINKQVDEIKILFPDSIDLDLQPIGPILHDLQKLTQQDEYGDITLATVDINLFDNIIAFTINIDS